MKSVNNRPWDVPGVSLTGFRSFPEAPWGSQGPQPWKTDRIRSGTIWGRSGTIWRDLGGHIGDNSFPAAPPSPRTPNTIQYKFSHARPLKGSADYCIGEIPQLVGLIFPGFPCSVARVARSLAWPLPLPISTQVVGRLEWGGKRM